MAIASADKLALYNGALTRLGERRLVALTEARKPRRVLDDIWGSDNNAVRYVLERGEWNFAIRAVASVYSPSTEPAFGFSRAHVKPDDLVRLAGLASDPDFMNPLSDAQYKDEAGYWFTFVDTIYLRYVSDDTDYGLDAAKWPETFRNAIETYLAERAALSLVNSEQRKQSAAQDKRDALTEAKSADAMGEGVKYLPHGSWTRARRSTWSGEQG